MKATIHIHSLFRSGSTYVFSLFRESKDLYCFYEPLHAQLSNIPQYLKEVDSADKLQSMRHPDLKKNYIHEFTQLGFDKCVPHFDVNFAFIYSRFNKNCSEKLTKYLEYLELQALNQHKQAALCYVRSPGMIDFIKETRGGKHIYVLRNPFDQFMSYWTEAIKHDNYYYLSYILLWACQDKHPIIRKLMKGKKSLFREIQAKYLFRRKALKDQTLLSFIRHSLANKELDQTFFYQIFLIIWLLGTYHAVSHCDVIIDIDKISHDLNYRKNVENSIEQECEISLDFSTAKAKNYAKNDSFYEIEMSALSNFNDLNTDLINKDLFTTTAIRTFRCK